MRITQSQLRRIIKEELEVLREDETAGTEDSGRGRIEAVQKLQALGSELSPSVDVQTSAVGDILNSLFRLLGAANTSIPGLEDYNRVNVEGEKRNLMSNLAKIK